MCLSPVTVTFLNAFQQRESIAAPCGKCLECVQADQNSWKIRMIEESKSWPYCYFFTLTYRDSALPVNVVDVYNKEIKSTCRLYDDAVDSANYEVLSTGCKKDIQDWLKRFRTRYVRRKAYSLGLTVKDFKASKGLYTKLKPELRYFICLEYGPNGTHRPHYHGCLFTNVSPRDIGILVSDWTSRYGFVTWSRVRPRNDAANALSAPANYVSKYCCKGEFSSRTEDIEQGFIDKAWRLVSKGLGAAYVERARSYHVPHRRGYRPKEYYDLVCNRRIYRDGDYNYKLPRYYIERFYYAKKREIKSVFNPKTRSFEAKTIYRFVPTTYLSIKIKDTLRERALARSNQREAEVRRRHPTYSDAEVFRELALLEVLSIVHREKAVKSKLNRFYSDNARRHPEL